MPSDKLPDILADLTAAATDADREAVKGAVDDLQAEIDRIEAAESVLLTRSAIARDTRHLDSEGRQRLDSLARSASAINLPRAGVVTTGAFYATSPSLVDAEDLSQQATDLAAEEEAFSQEAAEAESLLADMTLPPLLEVISAGVERRIVPKGTETEATLTVQNVGDGGAEDVILSSSNALSVAPPSFSLDFLEGGAKIERTMGVSGDSAGDYRITFDVESANAGSDTRSVQGTVLDKIGFIQRTRSDIDRVLESLAAAGLPKGVVKSIRKKIENADAKLVDAGAFARDSRVKQANNMIGAALNMLGAALNQLSRHTNGPSDGANLLVNAIEAVIDRGADARDADL